MSFSPTMRLYYSETIERNVAQSHVSISRWLSEYVTQVQATPLLPSPIWTGEVFFLDTMGAGTFSGVVNGYFTRSNKLHLKFTTGDILIMEFN